MKGVAGGLLLAFPPARGQVDTHERYLIKKVADCANTHSVHIWPEPGMNRARHGAGLCFGVAFPVQRLPRWARLAQSSRTGCPVDGLRNSLSACGWLKSNIPFKEPVSVSKEPLPSCPRPKLSSMKRVIEL